LEVTNEFIEGLHHRSWIIQLDQLKQRRRNDVEKLLSIFDQGNCTVNRHTLNVDENEYPETFRPIIRRLRMASGDVKVQTEMEMEDDFMKELQDKERLIVEQSKIHAKDQKALEKSKTVIKESKKALKEKDKTLKEKDKALEKNKTVIEKNKKALEEKDKALEEKDKLIKELKKQLAKKQV
jgi:DNA repair exonuclease SbcCD ATPase subunit